MVLLLLISRAAMAQQQAAPAEYDPFDIRYSLVLKVQLVLVTATVTDRFGRYVTDLEQDDFLIYEDGEAQEIAHFATENTAPKSVVILLDVSGSMRIMNKIGMAKESVDLFLNYLKPDDTSALVFFADGGLEQGATWTQDREAVRKELWAVKAYGKTALHDAVASVPAFAAKGERSRKAVLLITDGIDNASEIDIDAAVNIAQRTDLPIYSVGVVPSGIPPAKLAQQILNRDVLKRLADGTGGRFFEVRDGIEMRQACGQVISELGSQYVLGFRSSNIDQSGTFHKITVKTKRRGLRVRSRHGYLSD